ncbi:hypothetical protein SCHPADRAFT_892038 [Schizopora paradoxa]|uniref:Uncharacterized protein n=1 Tax=Schizopora paradoxa TaxID=27342 RepID=A0A0H2RGY5_9AGAM|nr:hypothetical protein SCHPADRAFT_892038 [Schizopora paradoxa]
MRSKTTGEYLSPPVDNQQALKRAQEPPMVQSVWRSWETRDEAARGSSSDFGRSSFHGQGVLIGFPAPAVMKLKFKEITFAVHPASCLGVDIQRRAAQCVKDEARLPQQYIYSPSGCGRPTIRWFSSMCDRDDIGGNKSLCVYSSESPREIVAFSSSSDSSQIASDRTSTCDLHTHEPNSLP